MEAMLKIEDLYSGYGKMEVLHGVSMEVRKGEIVALLGPNGAGKTTLLNSVFGIARIFKGSVMFSGENIVGRSPYKLVRMGIGYSPQLNNIFPNLS
ncbi:MAG: ABC transporter ATP-binding protein, partial [Thermoproteota archaeon]